MDIFRVFHFEHEQDLNLKPTNEFVILDEPVLNEPFEIHVNVKWECIPNETNEPEEFDEPDEPKEELELEEDTAPEEFDEPDEPEEELELEEDTAPVAVSEPYITNQCVVCLSKEPGLLFIDCLHRCVCLECIKTSPFHKCPSCRTLISIKVKI